MKAVYLPPIQELLNNATPLLKYLEKEVQQTEGLSFNIPLHVSRNEAAGDGRAENGTLPSAGKQGYSNIQVPAKYLYSRISISGPVIAATKSNKGSFLRALDAEMRGVAKDTRRSFNRQLHGDGRDALGFWVSGTGTSPIFDDGLGNPNGYDYFQSGSQTIDLISSAGATLHSGVTATRGSVGATGRTITTGTALASAASGSFAVRTGSFGKQMTGIGAAISDGNLHASLGGGGYLGVTVASQPDWAAQIVYGTGSSEATTASGRVDLSFPLLQQVFTAIASNSDYDESDIKLLLCSYQMRDKYVELCRNERVFYNNMKLDGGFEAVSYNGKPLVPDAQAKHNRISFICPDSMAIYRMADLDWMDKDGSILYRLSGGDVDGYGATLFVYQELGCKVRNANGALLNINE